MKNKITHKKITKAIKIALSDDESITIFVIALFAGIFIIKANTTILGFTTAVIPYIILYVIIKTKVILELFKKKKIFFEMEEYYEYEKVAIEEKIEIEKLLKNEVYDYFAILNIENLLAGKLEKEQLIRGRYVVVFGKKYKECETKIISKVICKDLLLTKVNSIDEMKDAFSYRYIHSKPDRLAELIYEHIEDLKIKEKAAAENRINELIERTYNFIANYDNGVKLIDEAYLIGLKNKCLKNKNKLKNGLFIINMPYAYKMNYVGLYKYKLPHGILKPYELIHSYTDIKQILGEEFIEEIKENYHDAPWEDDISDEKVNEIASLFEYEEWCIVFDMILFNEKLNKGKYYYIEDGYGYIYSKCQLKIVYEYLRGVDDMNAIDKYEFN